LNRQQKLLRKRLGLDIAPGIDVGMDKLFDDEDLLINPPETKVKSLTKQKSFEVHKTIAYVHVYVIAHLKFNQTFQKC